jgi:virulence factor Mce-like protein
MQKRAPTLANVLVICLFALSCFGLLLFLWESFGGSVPLKPKGYRFTVPLSRTLALSEQSDVRISGVNVGHVIGLSLGSDGRTHALIELDHRYAPIRSDDHAILRQKSLLGETYVQIIPQSRSAPFLPDGGKLPVAQVEPSVTLEDILTALDPRTRRAFQIWMQTLAEGFRGRGEDLNSFIATLNPFAQNGNTLVGVLAIQEGALRAVVHNTGVVFDALTEREGQFRGLIENGERTFHAVAQESQALADAFRALPTFERSGSAALRSIDSFAVDASPLLDQLRPAEIQLAPTLQAAAKFAPTLSDLSVGLGKLAGASRAGLPAFERSLALLTPILGQFDPFARNFNPFLQFLGQYVPELQALFANFTAASEAVNPEGGPNAPHLHMLRTMAVLNPNSLSLYTQAPGSGRANAYQQPGAFNALASGLPVFDSRPCANPVPTVSGPGNEVISTEIIELLSTLGFINATPKTPKAGEENTANPIPKPIPAPACNQQGPFTFNGQTGQFPRVSARK